MEKGEIRIDYMLYREELPEAYNELCQAAMNVMKQAYSIYSHFSVGAAVLLNNGEIVCGSNQENVAYPSGLCAERVALFYAGSAYPENSVKAMAIAASNREGILKEPITPCGACRQVMMEVVRRYQTDFDVVMIGGGKTMECRASDLLPFAF